MLPLLALSFSGRIGMLIQTPIGNNVSSSSGGRCVHAITAAQMFRPFQLCLLFISARTHTVKRFVWHILPFIFFRFLRCFCRCAAHLCEDKWFLAHHIVVCRNETIRKKNCAITPNGDCTRKDSVFDWWTRTENCFTECRNQRGNPLLFMPTVYVRQDVSLFVVCDERFCDQTDGNGERKNVSSIFVVDQMTSISDQTKINFDITNERNKLLMSIALAISWMFIASLHSATHMKINNGIAPKQSFDGN